MEAFEYANPSSLKEAVGLLGSRWGEAEVLAGGTDLLSLMKNYVATPKRLVSLKNISDLRGIESGSDGVRIGALVTLEELRSEADIQRNFPALVQAAEGVSSMQIRNMGTVGGDLCQRPRCWYFRNGFGLLARDAQGRSLVLEGDNRYHAILGNGGPAYFVHPSSLAPPLMALEARVHIFGAAGTREVSVEDFFRTPQSDEERETVLRPNEVLTAITIPASAHSGKSATYEVREREFLDWPLATASVALQLDGGGVTQARVVLGHVAPVPWRSREAEQALLGQTVNEATAESAGKAAVRPAKALSKNAYKIQLARVALKRALLAAMKGV
jgi:xanthine dehydrogenase YagS FAD-binding subunit